MTQITPKPAIMGTGEIQRARNPMEVESMAKRIEGPDRVIVVHAASSREDFLASSSNLVWILIA